MCVCRFVSEQMFGVCVCEREKADGLWQFWILWVCCQKFAGGEWLDWVYISPHSFHFLLWQADYWNVNRLSCLFSITYIPQNYLSEVGFLFLACMVGKELLFSSRFRQPCWVLDDAQILYIFPIQKTDRSASPLGITEIPTASLAFWIPPGQWSEAIAAQQDRRLGSPRHHMAAGPTAKWWRGHRVPGSRIEGRRDNAADQSRRQPQRHRTWYTGRGAQPDRSGDLESLHLLRSRFPRVRFPPCKWAHRLPNLTTNPWDQIGVIIGVSIIHLQACQCMNLTPIALPW